MLGRKQNNYKKLFLASFNLKNNLCGLFFTKQVTTKIMAAKKKKAKKAKKRA